MDRLPQVNDPLGVLLSTVADHKSAIITWIFSPSLVAWSNPHAWPSFDPESEKSGQGWTETMENPPNEWWQKAQIGAEMTPICAWDCLITRRSEVQVLPPQPDRVDVTDFSYIRFFIIVSGAGLRLLYFFLKRIIIRVVSLREQLFQNARRLAGNILYGNTLADVGSVVRMALRGINVQILQTFPSHEDTPQ